MSSKIKIHGVPMSQAVRAVLWLLFNKDLPFELVLTVPGSKEVNKNREWYRICLLYTSDAADE